MLDKHEKFQLKSIDDMVKKIKTLGLTMPISANVDALLQSVKLGDKVIPNSMAIQPMEGCDGTTAGEPDELTFRRYRRFASGGAGLIWIEATAVVPEGRANPRQLYLCHQTKDGFARLLDTIIEAAKAQFGSNYRPYTVIQLTHSGRYSKPEGRPAPIIAARNPYLDGNLPDDYPVISDEQLQELEDRFVEAAELASQIGFDAVDIKSCHRYLNSELLSAFTREGNYGGSFENRTRFLINIVDKIKQRLGDAIEVTLRLNVYDAIPYPYGWGVDKEDHRKPDLTEPIRLVKILRGKGIRMVNITCGNPYYNPHVNRPYDSGPYIPPEHPLVGVARMLEVARVVQENVPDMVVLSSGLSWLRHLAPYVAAGCLKEGWFKLAGFGRLAFAYPDFAKDIIEKGALEPNKCCIACGKCSEIMRDGGKAGCVIRDAEIYAPIYKAGREGKPPIQSNRLAEHV
ncbi:2,4-dienoyl-CoA reductase-like NADH-dependent reductase (Old Yellow Enzyme family) [Caldicoprobacter guelmensis]|uniref:oxidoreductase n=1 Tax=Caldicoprobacter guelmensis TaxID=1170224 RepID=UPI00195B3B21|nr:flavin oxidoreductase/NADH oxidase [Caldicoprobacter guelmensis]MBM7581622.1 2,4-dienoyl-CoA reductase-like NADH-dependent reductase (Old Yellow Enzyme family) [Caldicoprobacter guelmensis]